MIRFILIGYGWRADFFHRIAAAMPERFEITAAVLRTRERAKEVAKSCGVFATEDLQKALDAKSDFAVLCVPRGIVTDYLVRLMEAGMPVLCETPPGKNQEELIRLYREKQRLAGRVQVVEQYFLQPLYAAWLQVVLAGRIGEVSNMTLSALHGYHGVSIFRKFLGSGFLNCKISGRRFSFGVTKTNSRGGFDHSGAVIEAEREMAVLEFEDGRTAFFDFMGEQYFSLIRTRRLNIQGLRGEINDMTLRYLDDQNRAFTEKLHRIDTGVYNNSGFSHLGLQIGGRFVYQNPFYGARLNDDEIAVASCLLRMKEYVAKGAAFYPLEEALQDTYLSFLMETAFKTGQPVESTTQEWALT